MLVIENPTVCLHLDGALGVWIVRCFFRAESNVRLHSDVSDVVGLALDLQRPHRNRRVGEVRLVEVEHDNGIFENLQHETLLVR